MGDLVRVIAENRVKVEDERFDALLAVEDCQRAFEVAKTNLVAAERRASGKDAQREHRVLATALTQARLGLTAAQQRLLQLDTVLRELDELN